MAGERRAIESPLFVDFSNAPVPPMLFALQAERAPRGVVSRPAPGVTIAHTPWYAEFDFQLTGVDGVAVVYVIQYTDESNLIVASLDQTFEGFFSLMSGADYGDDVTKLVALNWPDMYAMLLHSNRRTRRERMLCNINIGGRVQWAVVEEIPVGADELSNDQALAVAFAAVQTFVRIANLPELPGLFDVLGGPDLVSRRLTATAGLFYSAAGVLGGFATGVPDLSAIIDGAREFVTHARALITDHRVEPT